MLMYSRLIMDDIFIGRQRQVSSYPFHISGEEANIVSA